MHLPSGSTGKGREPLGSLEGARGKGERPVARWPRERKPAPRPDKGNLKPLFQRCLLERGCSALASHGGKGRPSAHTVSSRPPFAGSLQGVCHTAEDRWFDPSAGRVCRYGGGDSGRG